MERAEQSSRWIILKDTNDIVVVRQEARRYSVELGFSLLDQTKIVTAASEIARNCVVFGRGGKAFFEVVKKGDREGLRITFEDHGPGIPDIALAMKDGYTTGDGLGMGLGGAKRLMDEFDIQSHAGLGTRVSIARYR